MTRTERRAMDRRRQADDAHAYARKQYQFGRADRVADKSINPLYRSDPYYRAGYEGERRKEVRRAADTKAES